VIYYIQLADILEAAIQNMDKNLEEIEDAKLGFTRIRDNHEKQAREMTIYYFLIRTFHDFTG